MRFIPTRIHALADYAVGVLLIAAPWLFGFSHNAAATWVPVVLGVGALVYSLCTRYELGVLPLIPMPVHLCLDFGSGALLALSPWLFGFAGDVWLPHVLVGVFEMVTALSTHTVPQTVSALTGRSQGLGRV